QSMDAALFSTAAATAAAPAGLLNGVVSVASSGTTGVEGVADDLGKLAKAIGDAGINPDDMVIITTPKLAKKLRVLASPKLTDPVLSSSSIADGDVIGIVPRGLITGYDGSTTIEVSRASSIHFEDTTPAEIVSSPGAVAAPTKSAFQQDFLVLKVRGLCAWTVHTGAIAHVTGAAW